MEALADIKSRANSEPIAARKAAQNKKTGLEEKTGLYKLLNLHVETTLLFTMLLL
jgi:hypothetical protein